jgi:type VI secretion system protein ImpL
VASYLIPFLFVIASILISWLFGSVLHLQGTALVLWRIVILALGCIAAFAVYWFWSRRPASGTTSPGERNASEITSLLQSAEQRLKESQRGGARSFDSLPLFYVFGAPNSSKTTTILKSGLDPELLAGQVYQDDVVVPTLLANVWYAKDAIFIDAGESLTAGSSQWNALVRQTVPGFLRSLFGSKRPLRAAVVCISSESFFGPDAASKVSSLAREVNATLRQMASQLEADLPVYVLLTKLDRVPGFAEYVKNLNTEETARRLGLSLSRESFSDGVYAERASSFLSSALDRLFYSLGEFRLEMLGREADAANTAAIYQFPRELQKLRNNLTSYLVELARPSHLNASPFLRGFFCVGVRAQIVEQLVSVGAEVLHRARAEAPATGILSLREIDVASQEFGGPQHVSRKTAQWCFLPQIFPDILLAKEGREQSASSNVRISLIRRIGLAAASALALLWIVGLTVSYFRNLQLERLIYDAAASLPANASPQDFAVSAQLRELDRLRTLIGQLERFEHDGPPLSFRWGLYRGGSLLEPARRLYFQRFRWLLLVATQQRISVALDQLPATAPPDADYLVAYNPLRAYLITTSFPQYSSEDFLTPILEQFWLNGRQPESQEQVQLAEQQFRFYSGELRRDKIYDIAPARPTVAHARGYLNSFGSVDRIYQNILAAAASRTPAVDFNRLFPGSAATVIETHIVPGAFTKEGFEFIQTALQNPDRYFAGEDWVLGPQSSITVQGQALSQKLAERYATDFSAQWQAYLRSATVVRYRSLSDARQKLESLSSPNSALLALIFTASRNTTAAGGLIMREFQPTQALVPATLSGRFVAPGNTAYVNGLIGLEGAVSQFTQDPSAANSPGAAQPVIAAAVTAHSAVSQTAQSFDIDPVTHVEQLVTRLMNEPITSVEEAVRGAAPEQINLAGRSLCSNISPILSKYPFNRVASVEATPAEVTAALKPDTGSLWQFYETNLKPFVIQQGGQWTPSPTGTVKPTPQFLSFFNRLAVLSHVFFANGASAPSLNFTAHILPSPGIQSVTLSIDGQRLSGYDVSGPFNWSAQGAQQAQLIASYGSNNLPLQFTGTWSLFHLVDRGRVEQSGNPVRLAYPLEISGTPIVVNGTPLTERIELSGSAASILSRSSLSGLSCPAPVAR